MFKVHTKVYQRKVNSNDKHNLDLSVFTKIFRGNMKYDKYNI